MVQVLALGVAAAEFDEVPVRHNEDKVNAALAKDVRWKLPQGQGADDPHAKANLLLQVCLLVSTGFAGVQPVLQGCALEASSRPG